MTCRAVESVAKGEAGGEPHGNAAAVSPAGPQSPPASQSEMA